MKQGNHHAGRWHYHNAGNYLAIVRRIRVVLDTGKLVQLYWSGPQLDRDGWQREFHNALDERINLKVGPSPLWRKLGSTYQTDLVRDQRKLRELTLHRIRHDQFATHEVRKRYGHRLAHSNDEDHPPAGPVRHAHAAVMAAACDRLRWRYN
ncbi:MAG: hypothetical protein M3R24_40680 [Chloroflexota bacterium]|nr:hypothetical protein [Chloroflexota bacterium]